MVEVPPELLDERRRLGIDVYDEMWRGVLHMNPPPSRGHQRLGTDLLFALGPCADAVGLESWYETGLHRTRDDYRVPDLAFSRPESAPIEAGIRSAELVVEIRSPHDETDDKLKWYLARGVDEVLVVDPKTRAIELFRLIADRVAVIEPDDKGTVVLRSLGGIGLTTVATSGGPRLQVAPPGRPPAEV